MIDNVDDIRGLPDSEYGNLRNLASQQHPIMAVPYFQRQNAIIDESEVMTVEDRMQFDKSYYTSQTDASNNQYGIVPNNIYFGNQQHENMYFSQYVPTVEETHCYFGPTAEKSKTPANVSMDYGYSSCCSFEDVHKNVPEYIDAIKSSDSIEDDVFHLEMSDDKSKYSNKSQVHSENSSLRETSGYNEPISKNWIQPDIAFTGRGMQNCDVLSSQMVPQFKSSIPTQNPLRSVIQECPFISTSRSMYATEDQDVELYENLYGGAQDDYGSPSDFSPSRLEYGVVPTTPCHVGVQRYVPFVSCHQEQQHAYEEKTEDSSHFETVGDSKCYISIKEKTVSKFKYIPEDSNEYAVDVYLWKCSNETRFQTKEILKLQDDITAEMRHTLLHWLSSVNRQFQFSLETWCLTVNIVDRFLSMQPLNKDCLQLVGLTALFLAAKQEEVEPPEISELVSLCARSYEHKQFRWMEIIILTHLQFQLLAPTLNFFVFHLIELETTSKLENKQSEIKRTWPMELTRKLIERVLCEERLARMPYSLLAHTIFDFLSRNFVMDCYDEIDECSKDEMFVDSYFKELYVDILDQYEEEEL